MSKGKPVILLIDDEPDLVNMLKMRIETEKGYKVLTAGNGQEGLDVISETHPDLIILDVMMPVMDGIEFYENIVDDNGFPKYPVLVLTAAGHLEELFLEMNANGFIAKPFDNKELLEEVDLIINKQVRADGTAVKEPPIITSDGKITVAVMENDEEKYQDIVKALKKEGIGVTNNHWGLSAIGELLKKRPNLILIKFGLVPLRGDILFFKLRRLARLSDVPMKIYVDEKFKLDSEVASKIYNDVGIDNVINTDETYRLVKEVKQALEEEN